MTGRDPEVWADQDLDTLLAHAWRNLDEALACHKAGAALAALVMLASAFEGVLLAAVVAWRDELATAGHPQLTPSRLHLTELVKTARAAEWLPDEVSNELVRILNTARTMAAHPGAFVRGVRQISDSDYDLADPAGFVAVYDIVYCAYQRLGEATAAYSARIRNGSAAAGTHEPGVSQRHP